jgi:hypothetical protein
MSSSLPVIIVKYFQLIFIHENFKISFKNTKIRLNLRPLGIRIYVNNDIKILYIESRQYQSSCIIPNTEIIRTYKNILDLCKIYWNNTIQEIFLKNVWNYYLYIVTILFYRYMSLIFQSIIMLIYL